MSSESAFDELTIRRRGRRELAGRIRKCGDLMAGEVDDAYGTLLASVQARGENEVAPVRRPTWIPLHTFVLWKKKTRAAAFGGDKPRMDALRRGGHEHDLGAIGRPANR